MHVSEQAVKNLLQIVYEKCGLRNRVELAAFVIAMEIGEHK